VNIELVTAIAKAGKPVVMSTGMSTVDEIDDSVLILEEFIPGNYALMHTNSVYPSPPGEINLRAIKSLKDRYGVVVGYSGHEYGLDPSVLSVSFGADIIERHITLDHTMWGTDQAASLEVHAMDMLRKRIMEACVCLGDGVKRVTESEKPIREKLRG
jgi:N-acetylneuraminate synthase